MLMFLSYSGVYGGAERLLVDFASGLEADCCVACPEGPLAAAARRAGLTVFAMRERSLDVRLTARDRVLSLPRLAGHALEVRALVRRHEPELIVVWGMRSAIAHLAARRRSSRPAVVFQHNDLLPARLIGALVRFAAARADRVIALSEAIARDLDPDGRLAGRLQVVHPGVDVDQFDGGPPPNGPPEVLVLGALVEWKRPDLALDAFALVRSRRPDARLRLVGAPIGASNVLSDRLRERAARPDLAGAVELAGPVDDPRQALRDATCLLHCAEQEPFGMAVLEALATGRPAVVAASAGPAEIVDSESGVLYRPGHARAAAEGVLAVLASHERAAAMGANGRNRAREHFDRASAQRKYAAALAPLIGAGRDGGGGLVTDVAGSDGRVGAAPAAVGTADALGPDAVAIVTVTHNSAAELESLLASVERHLPGARVVVADSASSDESVAVARAWSGGAVVVELDQNVGFGRACNRALAEVREPITLLLNPDVELVDRSLLGLAREVSRAELPERLLAPLVLTPDGSREDSVHPVPLSPADLLHAVVPPAALPGASGLPIAPWRADRPRRVGWAVGCALAAQTDTLRRLGPFDERIFLYGEDLELGLRAAAAGVETWFWPAARVLHHRSHSAQVAFGGEPFELLASARRDVIARRLGAGHARLDDAVQRVMFASRGALKRLAGRSAARERRQLEALAKVRSQARLGGRRERAARGD